MPELEILKSVTDKNIDSPASEQRTKAFAEADELLSYHSKPVEIVIEGHLYERINPRLKEEHKLVFQKYNIDNSTTNAPSFNIREGIRFIVKKRLPLKKSRIIILTENGRNYPEWEQSQDPRIKIYNSSTFLSRVEKFKKIKEDYDEIEDALITAFFIN